MGTSIHRKIPVLGCLASLTLIYPRSGQAKKNQIDPTKSATATVESPDGPRKSENSYWYHRFW